MKKPKKKFPYSVWRKSRSGAYYLSVRCSYKDTDGKYRMMEATCNDHTIEAVIETHNKLKELVEIKLNIAKFGTPTNEYLTEFKDFVEKWLEHKQETVRAVTVRGYESVLKANVLNDLGDIYMTDIDGSKIEPIFARLRNERKFRTAQLLHRAFSNMFKYAIEKELIAKNPLSSIPYPKNKRPKEIEYLTQEEARQFLELCQIQKHGLIFEFALVTGMRPEEYLGLQRQNVDLVNKVAIVRNTVDLRAKGIVFEDVKSSRSRRSIPLADSLVNKLKSHFGRVKSIDSEYQFVFPNETGGVFNPSNLANRHFKPMIATVCPDKQGGLYMLRHTCATLLLLGKENPKVVAERLGNSVKVVLETYSHVTPNLQEQANEKLNEMLYEN